MPPLQVTCFEQAAPHGGVLCSQQFRDVLVTSGERPTSDPATPAAAGAAASNASSANAAASATAAGAVSAGLTRILSLGFLGAPPPPRAVAGPQDAALCPVVRHKGLSVAPPPCQASENAAPPSSPRPATPPGQAYVDLAPVTLTSYTHGLEGDPDRSMDLGRPSFASSRFAGEAFSVLASPLLPGLHGSPSPRLAARSPSIDAGNVVGGDAGAEAGPTWLWRPVSMRPSHDARRSFDARRGSGAHAALASPEVRSSCPRRIPSRRRPGPLFYPPLLYKLFLLDRATDYAVCMKLFCAGGGILYSHVLIRRDTQGV